MTEPLLQTRAICKRFGALEASKDVSLDLKPGEIHALIGLHQAFIDQEMLAIQYRREDGLASERTIEPHYLLLKYPVWYVVAFDHLRDTQRIFRCDRILSADRTGTRFSLLPKDAFQASLDGDDLLM